MEKGLSVPLPNQVPNPVDLSVVPEHILRSGAVESLIQQNEDLMARLGVAIRRSSLLEERVNEVEQSLKSFKHRYEVLQDQVLVLREKDQILSARAKKAQDESTEAKQQLSTLETRYGQLYATNKERVHQLMENLDALARRVSRHIHHRRRLYRVALEQRHEIKDLRARLQDLEHKLTAERTHNHDLQTKLGEAAQHIQDQSKEAESNQRQLVQSYEAQLKGLRESLHQSQTQLSLSEDKVAEMTSVYETNISLENSIVTLKRSLADVESRYQTEVSQLQQQLSERRQEAKAKTLEVERLKSERDEARQMAQLERQEKGHLAEQVESLQCLWDENQKEILSQREKIEALQKLNQQLSSHLNQQRRELKKLREQSEFAEQQARQKLKNLKTEVSQFLAQSKALPSFKEGAQPEPQSSTPAAPEELQPEWMSSMDSLIADIQSKEAGGEETGESKA